MTEYISLKDLHCLVQAELKRSLPGGYWVKAETLDVRTSGRHCYLELIEKDEQTHTISAKARGYIWANTFEILRPYFEAKTGQAFTSGLTVLVKVNVEFHPVYGYGLNITDIDPSFTVGAIHLKRNEILNQLTDDGVLHMNRELSFPLLPQRVAIISSASAAGYGDFMKHLSTNTSGFVFYTRLFPAVMQGEQTVPSVIAALDLIYRNQEEFDLVVIIRGGGATSDLMSFDSYELALNITQFPLPVISGIGHERDETVVDAVSHFRAKTPTAAADFLIHSVQAQYGALEASVDSILYSVVEQQKEKERQIQRAGTFFRSNVSVSLQSHKNNLSFVSMQLTHAVDRLLEDKKRNLKELDAFLHLSSPQTILKKGYTMTLAGGKIVKSSREIKPGDALQSLFHDGKVDSIAE